MNNDTGIPGQQSLPNELMSHLSSIISERKQKGHGVSNIISGARIGYNWAKLHSLPPSGLMKKAIAMRDAYNSYIHELAGELFVLRGGRERDTKEEREKAQQDARATLSEALKPFIGDDLQPSSEPNVLSPPPQGQESPGSDSSNLKISIAFGKWLLRSGYRIPNSNPEYRDLWSIGHQWPTELKTSEELYVMFLMYLAETSK